MTRCICESSCSRWGFKSAKQRCNEKTRSVQRSKYSSQSHLCSQEPSELWASLTSTQTLWTNSSISSMTTAFCPPACPQTAGCSPPEPQTSSYGWVTSSQSDVSEEAGLLLSRLLDRSGPWPPARCWTLCAVQMLPSPLWFSIKLLWRRPRWPLPPSSCGIWNMTPSTNPPLTSHQAASMLPWPKTLIGFSLSDVRARRRSSAGTTTQVGVGRCSRALRHDHCCDFSTWTNVFSFLTSFCFNDYETSAASHLQYPHNLTDPGSVVYNTDHKQATTEVNTVIANLLNQSRSRLRKI